MQGVVDFVDDDADREYSEKETNADNDNNNHCVTCNAIGSLVMRMMIHDGGIL